MTDSRLKFLINIDLVMNTLITEESKWVSETQT